MVKIRLARIGKTGNPVYRIVAIEEEERRNGKAIEVLGEYNPSFNPAKLIVKKDRVTHWISKGAQPTDSVRMLLHL